MITKGDTIGFDQSEISVLNRAAILVAIDSELSVEESECAVVMAACSLAARTKKRLDLGELDGLVRMALNEALERQNRKAVALERAARRCQLEFTQDTIEATIARSRMLDRVEKAQGASKPGE